MKSETEVLTERITDRLTSVKNDVELLLVATEEIKHLKISCPRCNGTGRYLAPANDISAATFNFQSQTCGICGGDGKITVEQYEWLQEEWRGEGAL